jgi:putative tricarboxylic transport membrane protein
MEENLRRALSIARGDLMTFVERPVSAAMLAVALVVLVAAVLPAVRKGRAEAFKEES